MPSPTEAMSVGTQLCGLPFGVGDWTFVFAVRLAHQRVVAPIGKVALCLCVVDHVHAPFIGPTGRLFPGVLQA